MKNHDDLTLDEKYAQLLFYIDMDILRTQKQITKWRHTGILPAPLNKDK